jgi:hypothetical protein
MEKSMGAKTKKALSAGTMDVQSVFNMDVWQKQLEDDVRPVLFAIIQDAAETAGLPKPDKKDMVAASAESLVQLQTLNEQIEKDIGTAIKSALGFFGDDSRVASFKETLIESYAQLDAKDRYAITSHVTSSLWSQFSN